MDRRFKRWKFKGKELVNVEFYYPILIVQGELLDVRVGKRSVTLKKTPHLQFRRSVVAGGRVKDYQIDVIQERYLPRYVEIINEELAKTARLLRREHKAVREAIDDILQEARRLRSLEKIREAMEF